uniref:Fcf1, putative n=1 Tax=Theileria annulata TaxID=5874 RepID=A0A3B0NEI5_THEAN
MKISKNKRNKKIVEFYKTLNNLIEPFKVLIDGSFVFAALKNRIHIKQLLPEALGYNITPVITNCILNELKAMGEDLSGAVTVIKHFQKYFLIFKSLRIKCYHNESDNFNSRRCILSTLSNDKLFVATQDLTLIKWIRYSIMVFPSNTYSSYLFSLVEESKRLPKNWEQSFLSPTNTSKHTNTKKKKTPNPLSCLKKKKKSKEPGTHKVICNLIFSR